MSSSHDGKKKDGATEVVVVMLAIFLMVSFLVWYAASNRIVYYLTPVMAWLGQMWSWLPQGAGRANQILEVAAEFRRDSGRVTFAEWLTFTNACLRPVMFLVTGGLLAWLVTTLLRPSAQVRRQFSKRTDLYLEGMSRVFTGIAPILHIRDRLVKNPADPKSPWRRQTFPEEVLLNEKVGGKPLVVDGEAVKERIRLYFLGQPAKLEETRLLFSRMLGRQVVDLTSDPGRKVCFADRFSPEGKAIFALLCAYAAGDRAGYEKCRDQLNNSCRGAQDGRANLSVAQWLYDKHRDNAMARKLFAVHHWEYTYLYALFIEAKKMGKVTHADFLWLKPMNRILFYVLNTVGRFTPHTESAAAFSQYAFERACSRMNHVPLKKDENGILAPSIFVEPAVNGLMEEWHRWKNGVDEGEEWWKDEAVWRRLNASLRMPPVMPPASAAVDTDFDRQMRQQQKQAQQAFDDKLLAEVGRALSDDS